MTAAILIGRFASSGQAQEPATNPASKSVVAAIHCNYPPVSFWNKNENAPSGFFVDIMEIIGKRAGLKVTYVCENGWPEMMRAIESGTADLGALMKSAQREERLLFTSPVEMTYLSFFSRSQSKYADEALPEGHVVGVISGSMSYEQLKSRRGIELRTVGSYAEGVFGLLAGDIDLFAGEEAMILREARETGLEERIRKAGKPFLERERGIAVRKDAAALLARLNETLPGFIGKPEYQQIYLKWYGRSAPYWTARRITAVGGILFFASVCGMALWRYRSVANLNRELMLSIAERKRAEEILLASESMKRKVLDSVDDGFIVVDQHYRILSANRAYCAHVDVSEDQVIGRHCYEVSHRTTRPCHEFGEDCAVRRAFESGEPCVANHEHQDAEGQVRYVETRAFPIRTETGAVTSVIESVTNTTEKRLLEQERLKTQKLEAIGTLAGGIAHDFNNLLQGVFGYLSLARLRCDDREQGLAALAEAEKALHLSVNLTNQLLTFSKGGKPLRNPMALRPTVESAVRFALSGSRSGYRLSGDDPWPVEADEGQIGQVIQNIVLNGDQAMPDGGQIEISLRNIEAPGKDLPQGLSPGKYVEIAVADTGTGIPKEHAPRIFDPYFTTKPTGTGLGLATSYSIVRNHHGSIAVESQVGKGTTFFVYLPAAAELPGEAPDDLAVQSASTRKGRILLMDDDPMILGVAGELIRTLGHDVEHALDGEEALDKYRDARLSGRPFDVVILDLTIRGGMGGAETIRRLSQIDGDVKGIVSSGYSDDAVTSNFAAHGFKAFLKKPYNFSQLQGALSSLI